MKFKLSRVSFVNYWQYLKYIFGWDKKSFDETSIILINYARKYFELGNVFYNFGDDARLPQAHKFVFENINNAFNATGVSLEKKEVAFSKTLGEYLERYILSNKNINFQPFTIESSISELRNLYNLKFFFDYNIYTHKENKSIINLKDFEKVKFACVQGENLNSKSKILLPKNSIYYGESLEENFQFGPQNSSGCAGGFNKTQATISAILEIIERDAFLLHFHTKTSPKKIPIEYLQNVDEEFAKYILEKINYFKKFNIQIHFYNISSDIKVPVILCFAQDLLWGKWRGMFATSAKISLQEAILASLSEVYSLLNHFLKEENWQKEYFGSQNDLAKINMHTRAYFIQEKYKQKYEFLFNGENISQAEFQDLLNNQINNFKKNTEKNKNQKLVDKKVLKILLEKLNTDVYRHIVPNFYLREIGYCVVKVLIPSLYCMYLLEKDRHENIGRINNFLKLKNLKDKLNQKINTINIDPHPFP